MKLDALDEARLICDGDRTVDYGTPLKSYTKIAAMWSILLGITITPRQVTQCMMALKLVRDAHRPKQDNLIDIAGYVHCADKIQAGKGFVRD